MWATIVATLFSFLPRRWRAAVPAANVLPWERGGALSGFLEALMAFAALVFWYSLSVTTWAANGLDSAMHGGVERNVPGQAIGFAALVLWVLHPLTWLVGYFVLEGAVRMVGAAFAGHVMGTLPLYLADWTYGKLTGRRPEPDALYSPGTGHAASFVAAIKDQWRIRRLPQLDDEVRQARDGEEEHVEVRASRPKTEWVPPKIVRVADAYYRLEEATRGSAPRPFVYRLRKLAAGVPGRTVILYDFPPNMRNTK